MEKLFSGIKREHDFELIGITFSKLCDGERTLAKNLDRRCPNRQFFEKLDKFYELTGHEVAMQLREQLCAPVTVTDIKIETGFPIRFHEELKLGLRGFDGSPGINGKPGRQGRPGQTGREGRDGLPGQVGFPGWQGDRGKPGKHGNPGPVGEQGASGKPGEEGPPGEPGKSGSDEQGPQGNVGSVGVPGKSGETGFRGSPGRDGKVKICCL
jgi:hypothetical protein